MRKELVEIIRRGPRCCSVSASAPLGVVMIPELPADTGLDGWLGTIFLHQGSFKLQSWKTMETTKPGPYSDEDTVQSSVSSGECPTRETPVPEKHSRWFPIRNGYLWQHVTSQWSQNFFISPDLHSSQRTRNQRSKTWPTSSQLSPLNQHGQENIKYYSWKKNIIGKWTGLVRRSVTRVCRKLQPDTEKMTMPRSMVEGKC